MPQTYPNCYKCGKPMTRQGKFCGRSCAGSAARLGQLIWEQSVAKSLQEDGWKIISPTACCDRIGIKDGRVYFLEFKPQGNTSLRSFQKSVKDSAPHMYRVVVGNAEGKASVITGTGTLELPRRKKSAAASSKFMGVTWNKQKSRWRARITIGGSSINLGYFRKEEDAARAYEDELKRQTGLFLNQQFADVDLKGPTGKEEGDPEWSPCTDVIN